MIVIPSRIDPIYCCNNQNTFKGSTLKALLKNRTNNNHLLQSQHLKIAKYQKAPHFKIELGEFMQMEGLHDAEV